MYVLSSIARDSLFYVLMQIIYVYAHDSWILILIIMKKFLFACSSNNMLYRRYSCLY